MYGDVVHIQGVTQSVLTNSKTYKRLSDAYVRKGVLYEMRFPEVMILERGEGNFFKENTIGLNHWIKETITLYIREPSAGFINGILIGEKHGLSKV